ncbi:amino acid adenylation domain-containing protein [Actinomadura verrucosospora]|nr:amino acid adenylation domain-containing protein [Actinomadura verrucosospora]
MPARSEAGRYGKPISPHEWLALAHPRGLVMDVQLCVEGEGGIDPEALRAAVATASQACPGARLVRRGQRWVDGGIVPAVRVADAADFDRARLDSPLLRTPLTGEKSPSCEVVLVQGSPTTVVFRANHGVMDGGGAMLWQTQVFRALRGEPVEGAASPLTLEEVMERIADRLGIELPPRAAPSPLTWRSPLGNAPKGPRRSLWRRRTIDGAHPAATARIVRRVATHGPAQGPVLVPVDLRRYLPGLRTTGMVSGAVKLGVREDDDWTDVHAELLRALGEHRYLANRNDPYPMSMPLPLLRSLYRWIDGMAVQNPDFLRDRGYADTAACISHLGTVDLAALGTAAFEATSCYALGGVGFSPELAIVECQGRTEVTVAWRDGRGAADRVEALLDEIEDELSPRAYRVPAGEGARPTAPPCTLQALLAEQVARTPDAVAIEGADGALTYAELDRRAGAVAAALHARGIGRGDLVGLVAGRSAAAITALWGVLKAGAAYLPIDESHPDARIVRLLADARARICLLEPPAERRACLPPGCAGLSLADMPYDEPHAWQDMPGEPTDLAYVVYTSGSTGAPKGVEVEHRSVVNFVRWATRECGIDASTRMLLIPSISFDVAGYAFFLPLLAGGCVLPVREVNAATLRAAVEDGGATAMAVTPSHLELIAQSGVRRSTMRVVMAAGELLRRSTALRARDALGQQCRILNQWGPSEAAIVNTSHEFDPVADTDAGVPFGRPMDGNALYVLDARGRFVAPGELGEAYVGGVQVARGYRGRPDLTRERFVRLADGTRVYRTGDLVRRLPGGELTFVGRVDDQVKVAGHRIEPAEIAQTVEEHPLVRQAAVLPRTRPGAAPALCAYVVGDPGVTPDELRGFVAERLPRNMVPAAIVPVPEIPRTPNGKLDAARLPDPFAGVPADGTAGEGLDEVAAAVAGIWSRTLRLDAGLLDERADFHQLGGDSLLLLSMVREVSRTVVGRGEQEFMDELVRIVREPTLGRVSDVAREVRDRRPAGLTE